MSFWSDIGKFFTEKSAFERIHDFNKGVVNKVYDMFGVNSPQQQTAINLEEAQRNRDFQERMSNTSWQRGLEDMQKAGLNSALAYSQGGAFVPSGSTGSASSSMGMLPLVLSAVGAMSGVAKAAISANSASAVARQYTSASIANSIRSANTARTVAEIYTGSRKYRNNQVDWSKEKKTETPLSAWLE